MRAAGLEVVSQVLGVALPEEAFFRGYLLPQLQSWWAPLRPPTPTRQPHRRAMGAALVVTAFFFALGHWLGEWHPARLLTFFPGLLFGAVACRQRSLAGAIALHAACNLFAQGLSACLRPAG